MVDGLKLNGMAIKATDYGESDRIVRLYTLEQGKISAILKGVRKANARMKPAGQLFNLSEYILSGRGGMLTVTGYTPVPGFSDLSLASDYDRYIAACAVVEALDKATPDNEPNPPVYVLLLKAADALLKSGADYPLVLSLYLMKLLEVCGYRFVFSECVSCGERITGARRFDIGAGGMLCGRCCPSGSSNTTPAEGNILRILSESDFPLLAGMKFTAADVSGALRLLLMGYERFFGKLSSLSGNF